MKGRAWLLFVFIVTHGLWTRACTDTIPLRYDMHKFDYVISRVFYLESRFNTMDSLAFQRGIMVDVGKWFQAEGLMQGMSYGAAGAACSPRMMGLSASQVQVFWDQIPINSVTLGQSDLSLIPTYMISSASLSKTSTVSKLGATGISSNVFLGNNHNSTVPLLVNCTTDYSSLHNSTFGITIENDLPKQGNSSALWSRFKYYHQNAKNEFSFQDVYRWGKPWVQQEGNDAVTDAWDGMLGIKNAHGEWKCHFFQVNREAEIPNTMGYTGPSAQNQSDTQGRFTLENKRQHWLWISAITWEDQRYAYYAKEGESPLFSSLVRSRQAMQSVKRNWNGDNSVSSGSIQLDGKQVLFSVENTPMQNIFIPGLSLEQSFRIIRYHVYTMARLEKRNDQQALINVDGYVRRYFTSENHSWMWVLQGMLNQRPPSLNDLYYPLSGNVALKAEQSYGSKAMVSLTLDRLMPFLPCKFEWDAQAEFRKVTNWIQWVPWSNGLWHPINYKEVHAATFSSHVLLGHRASAWMYQVKGGVEYTKARGVNGMWSKQDAFDMIYTPTWRWNVVCHGEVSRFQLGMSLRYLGSRYTDENNSRATQLPEVMLWDIYGGIRFEKAEGSWEWRIRLDNISNVQYQEVRSYAMPGRVIGAQLSYTLHHKS